jgi:hypothetical protein
MMRRWRPLAGRAFLALAVAAFALTMARAAWMDTGGDNLYTHQAEAFLRGALDIPAPLKDTATYEGRHYVPFPPFPTLLLVPFVAAGLAVNPTLIALLLTIPAALAFRSLARVLGAPDAAIPWLIAGFFLGTGYWHVALTSSGVWSFAHVVAVACATLAFREAAVTRRAAAAGLLLGLAFLSRQLFLYSAPLALALLLREPRPGGGARLSAALRFAAAFGACVVGYALFNAARFGHPLQTGYEHIELAGFLLERVTRYGLFHVAYVPFNAAYLFFQGPHVVFAGPMHLRIEGLDAFGVSVTFASPFLALALLARPDWRVGAAAIAGVGLTVAHLLLYYNNGYYQPGGQRFALDFIPALMVLVAMAAPRVDPRVLRWPIAYAVALNVFGFVVLPVLRRVYVP